MDTVDLLLRGVAALAVAGVLAAVARTRFGLRKGDADGPADIGLD